MHLASADEAFHMRIFYLFLKVENREYFLSGIPSLYCMKHLRILGFREMYKELLATKKLVKIFGNCDMNTSDCAM